MKFHVIATVEYANGVAPGKDQLERVRKNLIKRLQGEDQRVRVITMTVEAGPPIERPRLATRAEMERIHVHESEERDVTDVDRAWLPRRCECELDHDAVGTHPAFHGTPENPTCQNIGTQTLRSDYGTFRVCPPCASDALHSGYYRRP